MAAKTTILFRNWPVKAGSFYSACHGLFKAEDGSVIVIGRILPGQGVTTLVDQLPKIPPSLAEDFAPTVAALAEMGINVNVGQRIWRKAKVEAVPEPAPEPATPAPEPVAEPEKPAEPATPAPEPVAADAIPDQGPSKCSTPTLPDPS